MDGKECGREIGTEEEKKSEGDNAKRNYQFF